MVNVVQAQTAEQLDAVRQLMRAFAAWHHDRHASHRALVDAYFDEGGFEKELEGLPGRYAPPRGRLLLATVDDAAAGCVALQDLGRGACEMKRLFVYPAYRGRGIGKYLAEAAIRAAQTIGYRVMRLDTGPLQHEAHGLYRRLGFTPTAPYGELSAKFRNWLVFMERELA